MPFTDTTLMKRRTKMSKENTFAKLNAINVNGKTEQKNGLTYLSWSWAWQEIKKVDPEANYTIYENADGWFYHTDGKTAWVKTGVTVGGVEHIEYLPVMDFKNKSIPVDNITSFDVNKAIQRSLTKACARHGLGLYIYAGEDLPEAERGDDETLRAEVKKLIQETNTDTIKFLLAMSNKFKREIDNVDEMRGKELDYGLERLNEKRKEMKK